jgi:hypothetical protein
MEAQFMTVLQQCLNSGSRYGVVETVFIWMGEYHGYFHSKVLIEYDLLFLRHKGRV